MILTFDIETIPCNDPVILADIVAQVKPPKTLKKAESIAKWWEEEGEAAKAEAIHKTGLSGEYGSICCIGWKFDNGETQSTLGDEPVIIQEFFTACDEYAKCEGIHSVSRKFTIVGHNITGFDLRFLWQRAIVCGIPLAKSIPWKAKPWDGLIQDTMLMWNPEREKRISLDRLCKALGVKSSKDGGIDGSKIAQAWEDRRYDEIEEYCRADVDATYLCYLKMSA